MSPDVMSELCVKTIVESGSRLDQVIYGVGALVHNAVCVQHKRGKPVSVIRNLYKDCY